MKKAIALTITTIALAVASAARAEVNVLWIEDSDSAFDVLISGASFSLSDDGWHEWNGISLPLRVCGS